LGRGNRRRTAWARDHHTAVATVANVAQHFDALGPYKTANGILATEGFTVMRSIVTIVAGSSLPLVGRFGLVVQDTDGPLGTNEGPITAPDRDWLAIGTLIRFGVVAGPVDSHGLDQTWQFRSRRRITDIQEVLFFWLETDAAASVSWTTDILLALP